MTGKDSSPSKNSILLIKSFGFLIGIGATMLAVVPLLLLFSASGWLSFDIGLFRFLGLIPVVGGFALLVELAFTFALYGRGTPAPFDPPKHLVICGPFQQVRNPGYLGAVTALVGEAILLQSAVVFLLALVMACFFHLFVVYYEEPGLKNRFGEEYEAYLKRVPRWLPKMQRA